MNKRTTTKEKRISIEFHHVIAFWIRTRHGVPGFLGFGYFQHAPAHVALQLNDLRAGWFWCIGKRSPDIG